MCGASAYQQKYYFNEQFKAMPQSIKEELRIICVLFTQEVGGTFQLVFDEEGNLNIETDAEETDIYYDEIGSALLVKKVTQTRQELFESLSMYYRVVMLHEDIGDLLEE